MSTNCTADDEASWQNQALRKTGLAVTGQTRHDDPGHPALRRVTGRPSALIPAAHNRSVNAMMAKDVHAMNVATQELADLKAAHQDLADDIAKYKASTGIEPADAAPAAPEPTKPRRARKPTK